jgi:hypothetical protein
MRSVAEIGGAGFSPQQAGQVGGFQAPQGLLARQLGLQSVQLSQMGNQISQSWQAIAGSFIESPLQVGQARLGYEKAAADIQLAKAQAEAGMAVDVARGSYGTAVNTIGANLAANQALSSGIAATGQALGSGVSSYGMASALQGMQAQAVPAASASGGYATSGAARQAAPYAASVSNVQGMGYVPRAQAASPSAARALTGAYG